MSGRTDTGDTFDEPCDDCGRETPHSVKIELRTESKKRRNAIYSREPYRVASCRYCGRTRSQRMNNA